MGLLEADACGGNMKDNNISRERNKLLRSWRNVPLVFIDETPWLCVQLLHEKKRMKAANTLHRWHLKLIHAVAFYSIYPSNGTSEDIHSIRLSASLLLVVINGGLDPSIVCYTNGPGFLRYFFLIASAAQYVSAPRVPVGL